MELAVLGKMVCYAHGKKHGQVLTGHSVFEMRVEGLDSGVGGGIRFQEVLGFNQAHVCLHDEVCSLSPPLHPVFVASGNFESICATT